MKRKYGSDENFDIIINPDKGDLEIWRNRIVVDDGKVEDPNQEIELTEARKIEPDFEVGEDVSEEVKLIDLGRRVILSLRQNLVSKIHEHDSTNVFKQFKELEGNSMEFKETAAKTSPKQAQTSQAQAKMHFPDCLHDPWSRPPLTYRGILDIS